MTTPAPYFLSYAHADQSDVDRFLHVLLPLLKISPKFDFTLWKDNAILPGEHWLDEIDAALDACRFGILCLTPNFLASDFITKTELPVLLAKPLVVPVAIHHIPFDGSLDLKGLEKRQIFHLKGRTFDACNTGAARREFAEAINRQIAALLDKY
jgi:hypothetical protein